MNGSSTAAAAGVGYRPPPYTASQWQELEHQALIFKYMMAGVPVPHELLLPIRRSLEAAMASRFYHHPARKRSPKASIFTLLSRVWSINGLFAFAKLGFFWCFCFYFEFLRSVFFRVSEINEVYIGEKFSYCFLPLLMALAFTLLFLSLMLLFLFYFL